MKDGALDHPLEAQSRLSVDLLACGENRSLLSDLGGKSLTQIFDVGAAALHETCGVRAVEQGEQQMFYGDELMTLLPSLYERVMQDDFELLRDHRYLQRILPRE
jgi:hypothetical protein